MQGETIKETHETARLLLDELGYDTTGLSAKEIAELGRLATGLENALETARLADRDLSEAQAALEDFYASHPVG